MHIPLQLFQELQATGLQHATIAADRADDHAGFS